MRFGGETYDPAQDHDRLKAQLYRVRRVMQDGEWRTLFEIRDLTGDPPQSISARLRDFRKEQFGGHTVNRRRRGEGRRGLFEYQLILHEPDPPPAPARPWEPEPEQLELSELAAAE